MSDPIAIANLALSLLSKTTEALNALRERSQRTKDIDIKDQISLLYDNVLGLKEVVSRMLDEDTKKERRIQELQHQLEQEQRAPERPKIKQVGNTNYYYKGNEGPFCQPCYDKMGKLITLLPIKTEDRGGTHRDCPVCHAPFYEIPNPPYEATSRRGTFRRPHGWMG